MAGMKILHGLLAGQVLQRSGKNRGAALVRGSTRERGAVEARLEKGGKVVRGFEWKSCGRADGREFVADLKNLPVGGPYTVRLRIGKLADVSVPEIFVGDVWFLAGQSNMEGCGNLADALKPHPLVRAFYMQDAWGEAKDPLNFMPEAVDVVHNTYGNGPMRPPAKTLAALKKSARKGVSAALPFAQEMLRRTGVPQGLVACSHGGTSMEQWSPRLRDKGGASLYGAMIRRFVKLGQPVAGVLWYQGESDALHDRVPVYTERMKELVAATRRDMGLPKLPWLMVQIAGVVPQRPEYWSQIQEQQRNLPGVIPHLDVVPALDLGLDDQIHISGVSHRVLGKRLARVADRLAQGNRKAKPSIAYSHSKVEAKTSDVGKAGVPVIEVHYENVAGALRSDGLPYGFRLHDPKGRPADLVYKTTLRGNVVVLELTTMMNMLSGYTLSYGCQGVPCGNITDGEGMSLPAMWRVPLNIKAGLPYALNWQSALLRKDGGMKGITLKEVSSPKRWTDASSELMFVALPRALSENRDGTWAMRTTVTAKAATRAILEFGADSPFILWINGKKVLEDPKAINPVLPGQYIKPIRLKKGKNDVQVAFDSRQSAAWGVCLLLKAAKGDADLADTVQLA